MRMARLSTVLGRRCGRLIVLLLGVSLFAWGFYTLEMRLIDIRKDKESGDVEFLKKMDGEKEVVSGIETGAGADLLEAIGVEDKDDKAETTRTKKSDDYDEDYGEGGMWAAPKKANAPVKAKVVQVVAKPKKQPIVKKPPVQAPPPQPPKKPPPRPPPPPVKAVPARKPEPDKSKFIKPKPKVPAQKKPAPVKVVQARPKPVVVKPQPVKPKVVPAAPKKVIPHAPHKPAPIKELSPKVLPKSPVVEQAAHAPPPPPPPPQQQQQQSVPPGDQALATRPPTKTLLDWTWHYSETNQVDWTEVFKFVPRGLIKCGHLFPEVDKTKPYDENFQKLFESYLHEVNEFNGLDVISQSVREKYMIFYTLVKAPFVKTVCETGFGIGYSSFVYLAANPNVHVYSFDVGSSLDSKLISEYIQENFPGRLTVLWGKSAETLPRFRASNPGFECDMIIMDGGKDYSTALAEFENFELIASKDNVVILDDYPSEGTKLNLREELGLVWERKKQYGRINEIFRCQTDFEGNGHIPGFSVGRFRT